MDIDVIKFGGSSLSNNLNLNIAANKILKIKSKNKSKIVVIVSAQGSTTNELLKEAKELAAYPNKRELDALLSIGEQKSASLATDTDSVSCLDFGNHASADAH